MRVLGFRIHGVGALEVSSFFNCPREVDRAELES